MLLLSAVAVAAPTRIEARAAEVAAAVGEDPAVVESILEREVQIRLEAYPRELITPERVARHVVDYEAFKLQTFLTSGVCAKRYFGFVDQVHDTAEEERRVMETVAITVEVANRWLEDRGESWRITDQEVLVTFYAEGGAHWLGRQERFHPILDVGLDDLAAGAADLDDLARKMDAAAGTELAGVVPEQRHMTLEEAVAGTALMWVWEKDIADRKVGLDGRDRDEQFIVASLVYNSGDPHSRQRWDQVRAFDTKQVVWDKSEANATRRWRLPVWQPSTLLSKLAVSPYPWQGTDWLAMLHIVQRYSAYVALERFTEVFEEGFFSG